MDKIIKKYLNHKGLTLIEILASITILTIVILSFLAFFSQAMLFSGKAEDRVTSINIAETVLSNVKDQTADYTGKNPRTIDEKQYKEIEPIIINNKSYYPYVNKTQETPEELKLQTVHVLIFTHKSDNTPVSETYGYLKLEDKDE
ncbi:prepilin-type N-terminal cleavage/methylation domain-containing protein [Bacillus sp. FJAT-49711]|uniref:type IV pilus modification PilV family protein n=1 Tax=Bacillus sp. FJAT-49711 TaxID=2833585 RepID=UPI001BCA4551|nr:prepilin-type N-terminal cleavage/methylation domain-containing protein [Bacillus sp. FJAT-49711]MBS4216993.1 prepilin-type N-terminal cleavage/methylation domain-containing protein [Bacillus sp. FJAT-49711]